MALLVLHLTPDEIYNWEVGDIFLKLLRGVVRAVIGLAKSPELFYCGNLHHRFVRQVKIWILCLKRAATLTSYQMAFMEDFGSQIQARDFMSKVAVYGFSVNDYLHQWDHFLFGEPYIPAHPVPMDPTHLAAHTFLSGGVRLCLLWEQYCHRARIGVSRVSRVS
jgi:hypothetical protein